MSGKSSFASFISSFGPHRGKAQVEFLYVFILFELFCIIVQHEPTALHNFLGLKCNENNSAISTSFLLTIFSSDTNLHHICQIIPGTIILALLEF